MESLTPEQVIEMNLGSEYLSLLKGCPLGAIQAILFLEKRCKDLERTVYKKESRITLTRTQKMLVLKDLGMLAPLLEHPNKLEAKAKILSDLIEFSVDNIEDDLSNLNAKYPKSRTISNYRALSIYYAQNGYTDLARKAEITLEQIRKEKQEVKRVKDT